MHALYKRYVRMRTTPAETLSRDSNLLTFTFAMMARAVFSDLNVQKTGSATDDLRLLQALVDSACVHAMPVHVHALLQVAMREWLCVIT